MLDNSVSLVEADLRSVLGELFECSLGSSWQQHLSKGVAGKLARKWEVASKARAGVPEDPWQAAGLSEIGSVAAHFLRRLRDESDSLSSNDSEGLLRSSLSQLWRSPEECEVDINRLLPLRHDQSHPGVTAPPASVFETERAVIMKRLRLGCEAIRRRLTDDEGEWWPYIERVTCPGIDGWLFERKTHRGQGGNASLVEGDHLEFVVEAVNPRGPDDELEYGLCVQPDGGYFSTLEWKSNSRLLVKASPPGRRVTFLVAVRSAGGGHSAGGIDDEAIFMARIKPAAKGGREEPAS